MSWPLVALSDFCRTGSGGTPSRRKNGEYYVGSIPWVKSGELRDDALAATDEHITDAALRESSAKMVPTGAVLIAMYGATVGRTALLEIDASTNQAVCFVVPEPKLAVGRYVWYALRASYDDLLAKRVGGAQPNISQQIIRRLKIPLPPPSEQRRIVEILDQADALRKLCRETDAKVARILPALFLKMFGDPATNPMGWPKMKIGELARVIRGASPRPKGDPRYFGGKIPWIKISDVHKSGKYLYECDEGVTEEGASRSVLLEPGTLILSNSASVGTPCILKVAGCIHDGFLAFLDLDSAIERDFLYATFLIEKGRLKSLAPAGTQANLNTGIVKTFQIAVPPVDLQRRFVRIADDVAELEEMGKTAGASIDSLWGNLLQRAFSGRLTAKWHQARMQELLAEMREQVRLLNLPMPEAMETAS